jgi:hypothetical protein
MLKSLFAQAARGVPLAQLRRCAHAHEPHGRRGSPRDLELREPEAGERGTYGSSRV